MNFHNKIRFIELFPHPDLVQNLSKTVIKNRIRALVIKRTYIRIAEQRAVAILEAAKFSYPAVDTDDVLCEQLKIYARCYQELLHQNVALTKWHV